MRTAIIGGGAAGFFLAVNLKEMCQEMEVVIFEKSNKVLRKVAISGGGRCNCTNSFADVKDLKRVYPRGHRLMKKLFNIFDYKDAYTWFEAHGVKLMTQEDNCVFPLVQDSQAIIDCLINNSITRGIKIRTSSPISSIDQLKDFDFVALTSGGMPKNNVPSWLTETGHIIEKPIPSLFTLSLKNKQLSSLMGIVVDDVSLQIIGTKFEAEGTILITHWGISGPATLRLSSYSARWLNDNNYSAILKINWLNMNDQSAHNLIDDIIKTNGNKLVINFSPHVLQKRLWHYLLEMTIENYSNKRWKELSKNDINKIINRLTNDQYTVLGRAEHKDEFVTCGGVSLKSIDAKSLESKHKPNLFFAGEVLDIDGITGGFNFQAAWTTGFVVAKSIASKAERL